MFYNQPVVTLTGVLTAFTTVVGTPSATQNFTVSGLNLTSNLDITAPTDFEVSLNAGSGFGSTVSLTTVNSVVATTMIYVRYNPSSAGIHSGVIDATSTGALTQSIAVDGVSGNAGIDDLVVLNGIHVFPNPVIDNVVIQIENEVIDRVEVYSLSGQLLYEIPQVNSSSITFSLCNVQTGSYVLKVYSDKGIHVERVCIQ